MPPFSMTYRMALSTLRLSVSDIALMDRKTISYTLVLHLANLHHTTILTCLDPFDNIASEHTLDNMICGIPIAMYYYPIVQGLSNFLLPNYCRRNLQNLNIHLYNYYFVRTSLIVVMLTPSPKACNLLFVYLKDTLLKKGSRGNKERFECFL